MEIYAVKVYWWTWCMVFSESSVNGETRGVDGDVSDGDTCRWRYKQR